MERRDAVKYISLLFGGALVGGEAFLLGCNTKTGDDLLWQPEDIDYLNEIGEIILPRTATPGAKDAKVGEFMTVMVNDCYDEEDQKVFREGMKKLNDASNKKYDALFIKISAEQRKELLTELDKEAKNFQNEVNVFNKAENEKAKKDASYAKQKKSPHYFTMMKQLTLLGFFTSEAGAKKALRYEAVPGRYDGCIPYKKGDRAWA